VHGQPPVRLSFAGEHVDQCPHRGRPRAERGQAYERGADAEEVRGVGGHHDDPALDLLARDADGQPVAAATAWAAGPGRCGILEPMGTHRAARGRGHGRGVVLAALAALARAGASGVTVHTPASNSGAVATYVSCGLRPLQSTEALVRGIQRSTSASPTP